MNEIHLIKTPTCSQAYSPGVTACAIPIIPLSVERGLRVTRNWTQVSCCLCRNTIVYNKAMNDSNVGMFDSW